MRLLTIDHELGPIEESERLAQTWSPDDVTRNETPITKYEDGRMVQEVNFGNKVKLVASETARVGAGIALDVMDEFVELADELDNSLNGYITLTHPIMYPLIQKANATLQKDLEYFKPKTSIGKMIDDIGSEISLLIANEALLRKVRFFKGVPKYTQKFGEYVKNLSKSALRWGTAESGAAFVARENEGEPFTLFLSDLTGITDENDLKYIRETFQEAMHSGDSVKDLEVRMYQAMDGMLMGVAFESVFAPLSSLYKIINPIVDIKATAGSAGASAAAVTAEHIEAMNQLNALNNQTAVQNSLSDSGFED